MPHNTIVFAHRSRLEPTAAQAKFDGVVLVLTKDPRANTAQATQSVRVLKRTGISSEVVRAFVAARDFTAVWASPSALSYETYTHIIPNREPEVGVSTELAWPAPVRCLGFARF